ncbi:MAG: fumarate hydrolyase [Candidatus Abyssobacteria bacterium SURF_5]|uniref:Fumarate hydrolyase n=1 Tax=Abyssobacteria bacterium (strain SURF_5) TaxID=2093360 RepID=A0A3A4NYG7_ABYX5|nr:MAG: fumarate hydrolyase [Candidatus Abyssubacteria bacterium SURF_5]
MTEYRLETPLKEDEVRGLRIGDTVRLSGLIYTARDRAHKYLIEEATPDSLEFDLRGGVIYHCGPLIRQDGSGYEMVVAGPTTSNRMNPYQAGVIARYGVRAIIGKGGMDDLTLEALKRCGCVYLSAVSGAAVVLARYVKRVLNAYMLREFGMPECFWQLEVEQFPAIVTMDTRSESIHKQVEQRSSERLRQLQ